MTHAHPCRGRLAPSPTGYLHLGNAWAFLLAWLAVRAKGGSLVLRMEDIDPDRSRAEYAAALVEDLHWLGLDWDEGPEAARADKAQSAEPHAVCLDKGPHAVCLGKGPHAVYLGKGAHAAYLDKGAHAPYAQSQRTALYEAVLTQLQKTGHIYPCYCTRKELRTLAGAPHVDDAGAPYPGRCRHRSPQEQAALAAQGRRPALRLRCPDEDDDTGLMTFEDEVYGPQRMHLAACGGDFALRRSDGVLAYQLAVVADDHAMGITHIVRGRDILVSTPRQLWLYHLLGWTAPHHAHIPLLLDATGERLAKRHQSLSLRALRERGVQPWAIVGLLGHLARCRHESAPCRPAELVPGFTLSALPHEDIHVTPQHLDILYSD